MKQFFVLVITLFISSFCYAQSNLIDVVYLKNGSMIRGIIIEQVPNQSLKIRTSDGSVFVYNISDVEKMTREEPVVQQERYYGQNTRNIRNTRNYTVIPSNKTLRGYKGFVDAGYTFSSEYEDRVEISTSHGYQFNNYLFVGGGVGYHYYSDPDVELYAMPIFANFRANFMNKKVTPFTDLRVGYSVGDLEGGYAYIGLGARFQLVKKMALNLTLGFSYQEYDYYSSYSSWYYEDTTDSSGFNIKFGFEF